MQCKDANQLLSAYHDRALAPELAAGVARHLAVCSFCQEQVQALARVDVWLKTMPLIEPSANFKAKFWQRVERERKLGWWLLLNQMFEAKPALVFASLILATVMGAWMVAHVLPVGQASPLLEWAQGAQNNARSGGFSL